MRTAIVASRPVVAGAEHRGQGKKGISRFVGSDILAVVTKRLIDVDDEKLDRVRSLLGTTTLKSTVDAALEEVLALDLRRRALLAERGHEDALADPDRRQAAWR